MLLRLTITALSLISLCWGAAVVSSREDVSHSLPPPEQNPSPPGTSSNSPTDLGGSPRAVFLRRLIHQLEGDLKAEERRISHASVVRRKRSLGMDYLSGVVSPDQFRQVDLFQSLISVQNAMSQITSPESEINRSMRDFDKGAEEIFTAVSNIIGTFGNPYNLFDLGKLITSIKNEIANITRAVIKFAYAIDTVRKGVNKFTKLVEILVQAFPPQ